MIQRFYSIILLYLCFVCIPAYADDAQMLHIRRIKDLWQMADLEPMKLQAKEFFALYPNSPFKGVASEFVKNRTLRIFSA